MFDEIRMTWSSATYVPQTSIAKRSQPLEDLFRNLDYSSIDLKNLLPTMQHMGTTEAVSLSPRLSQMTMSNSSSMAFGGAQEPAPPPTAPAQTPTAPALNTTDTITLANSILTFGDSEKNAPKLLLKGSYGENPIKQQQYYSDLRGGMVLLQNTNNEEQTIYAFKFPDNWGTLTLRKQGGDAQAEAWLYLTADITIEGQTYSKDKAHTLTDMQAILNGLPDLATLPFDDIEADDKLKPFKTEIETLANASNLDTKILFRETAPAEETEETESEGTPTSTDPDSPPPTVITPGAKVVVENAGGVTNIYIDGVKMEAEPPQAQP